MTEPDPDLLRRAVEGDVAALKDLLKLCGPQARAAIQGKIDSRWRSVLDEDDVMQVTYLEAFLHIDQLVARDVQGFSAWLTRIAQNVLRDALRGLQRDKRPNPARRVHLTTGAHSGQETSVALLHLLGVTTTTPSRVVSTGEAVRSIDAALEQLPPDYRTVVELCDLKGIAVADVAGRLGRSVGAVHMLRARAHDRLRAILGRVSQFFSGSV